MNDMKKKRIVIGMFIFILLIQSGCGQKEFTFVNAEEESAIQNTANVEPDEKINEKTGQIQKKEAYNVGEEQADLSEDKEAGKSIFVYVCGAVVTPGVYELEKDARAFQAVEKAGGFLEESCEEALNLAKTLEDGEQLYIPTMKEWEENGKQTFFSGSGDVQPAMEKDDGLVNINTASLEELCTLPGVGESKAASIIAYREENGGFSSIEEIKNINGIKDGLFGRIQDKIKVND